MKLMLVFSVITICVYTIMMDDETTEPFVLTTLEPGVYSEHLGGMRKITKKIELYFKMDLNEVRNDIQQLEKLRERIVSICNTKIVLIMKDCSQFLLTTKTSIVGLFEDFERALKERNARGLIDVIGSGAKFLFGTMDAKDRHAISLRLRQWEKTKEQQGKINDKFAVVIEKEFNELNSLASACTKNGKLIGMVGERIDILNRHMNETDIALQVHNFLSDLQMTFYYLKYETDRKISNIHEMFSDFHNHILNTRVISYDDILKQLDYFQSVDNDRVLPIELRSPDLEKLRKLLNFALLRKDDVLYVVFTIPLVDRERFSMVKLYPIPKLDGNLAKFIELENDFVILDQSHEKITILTEKEVNEQCKVIKDDFYCEHINVVNKAKDSCIHKIFYENFNIIENFCNTKVLRIENTQLIKTQDANKYITIAAKINKGKLVTTKRSKISLEGTQLLEVKEAGTLYLEDLEITFHELTIKVNTTFDLVSKIPFDTVDLNLETLNEFPTLEKTGVLERSSINDLGKDIEVLKKEISKGDEKEENENIQNKSLIILLVLLLLMIAFLLSVVGYMINFKKKFKSKNDKTKINVPRLTKSETDLVNNLTRIEDDSQNKGGEM